MGGFIPAGAIATFSQAVQLGRSRSKPAGRRRKKRKAKARSPKKRSKRSTRGKPRPGTKAWMAYIRTKRKKR